MQQTRPTTHSPGLPIPVYAGDGADVPCTCGDARALHRDGVGPCLGVSLGTFGDHSCGCQKFEPMSADLVRVRCAVPSCLVPRLVPRDQSRHRMKMRKIPPVFYREDEQEFYPKCPRIDCRSAWAIVAPAEADFAFAQGIEARRILHLMRVALEDGGAERAWARLKELVERDRQKFQDKVDAAVAGSREGDPVRQP